MGDANHMLSGYLVLIFSPSSLMPKWHSISLISRASNDINGTPRISSKQPFHSYGNIGDNWGVATGPEQHIFISTRAFHRIQQQILALDIHCTMRRTGPPVRDLCKYNIYVHKCCMSDLFRRYISAAVCSIDCLKMVRTLRSSYHVLQLLISLIFFYPNFLLEFYWNWGLLPRIL